MPKNLVEQILDSGNDRQSTYQKPTNSRAKRLLNWIFGRNLFNDSGVKADDQQLYEDYNQVFNLEKDSVKRVLEDLANQGCLWKPINDNTKNEGKRQLFLYILAKITKEPVKY